MSPMAISLVASACIFGGTLLGMFLRRVLPAHHVSDESKDAVKLGIGMIATLAALVLGLLIASAKGTFDTTTPGSGRKGLGVILLDRVMADYGPETGGPRICCAATSLRRWSGYGRRRRSGQWYARFPPGRSISKPSRTNSASCSPGPTPNAGFSPGLAAQRRYRRRTLAHRRADGAEFASDALLRDVGLLAHHHLHHLWPVISPQRHGHCHLVRLRLVGRGLTLSDHGVGPPPMEG